MDIITKSLSTTKVVDFNFKINILNKKKVIRNHMDIFKTEN